MNIMNNAKAKEVFSYDTFCYVDNMSGNYVKP
jgi:hypothetical protein